METQFETDEVDRIDREHATSPELISVSIPNDFHEMDLPSQILYVTHQLQLLERKYPMTDGGLVRHTFLAKIEKQQITYSVKYLPYSAR